MNDTYSDTSKKNRAPSQTDFALLTINDSEDQAVKDVFKDIFHEKNQVILDRGIYSWGVIDGTSKSDQFVIVHASSGDVKGPIPAIKLIRELDRQFRPHFLLVLGTAGGIKQRGINYGQVIFSRQVHAGYQQLVDVEVISGDAGHRNILRGSGDAGRKIEVRLFDDPVQPPFDRLYLHAKNAAFHWKPKDELISAIKDAQRVIEQLEEPSISQGSTKSKEELLEANRKGQSTPHDESSQNGTPLWRTTLIKTLDELISNGKKSACRPGSTEIFSGSYLVDGHKSELFKSILKSFPKVGAVEMEAGAVAQAVLHSVETDRFLGYLVIKGISDVIDSDVPHTLRKEVRSALSFVASRASAEFARALIESWQPASSRSIGRLSLVPPKYSAAFSQELNVKHFSNSVVYEGINLQEYSRLLRRLCASDRITSAWTFCYLDPCRFFSEMAEGDQGFAARIFRKSPDEGELSKRLLLKFPHFEVFIELAEKLAHKKPAKGSELVVRVMHAGNNWDHENRKYLKAFAIVNGANKSSINCHVLEDKDFDGEDRWPKSDQVVLNEELLFDFNNESKRLIVTYLDANGLREAFIRFRKHCEARSNANNTYDARMRIALSSVSRNGRTVRTRSNPNSLSR